MKCSAKAKSSGNQCRRDAISGGTVCQVHGGAAPQVKRKAAERIAEARDSALEALTGLIADGKVDARVALDAVVKLTETHETLEGRVSARVEVSNVSEVDRELERLADELRSRTSSPPTLAENGTPRTGYPAR